MQNEFSPATVCRAGTVDIPRSGGGLVTFSALLADAAGLGRPGRCPVGDRSTV